MSGFSGVFMEADYGNGSASEVFFVRVSFIVLLYSNYSTIKYYVFM